MSVTRATTVLAGGAGLCATLLAALDVAEGLRLGFSLQDLLLLEIVFGSLGLLSIGLLIRPSGGMILAFSVAGCVASWLEYVTAPPGVPTARGLVVGAALLFGLVSGVVSGSGTRVIGEWDSGEGEMGADLDDFVAGLLAANPGQDVELYLVLHSVELMPGSIRGQLVAQGASVPAMSTVAQVVLVAGLLLLAQAARTGRR